MTIHSLITSRKLQFRDKQIEYSGYSEYMTHLITRNLPKNPGKAAWNALLSPADAAHQLTDSVTGSVAGSVTADWLIIGGGFAGISAARRLAQHCGKNETIALIEAGRIGEGPAGRNSGFMIDLPHVLSSKDYAGNREDDLLQIKMNRRAIDFALDCASEYGLDEEIVAKSGKINGAASAAGVAHNIAYATHLDELGEASQILDAKMMREACGTSYYDQGLYTPGTVMLHPAAYVRGIAAGLANRVSIYENSPVIEMDRANGIWSVTSAAGGTIKTPHIIMAVNGHIESFGFFKRRLMHVFLFASMTRRLTDDEEKRLGGQQRWGITPSDPIGTTVRRIHGRSGPRIVVRNQSRFAASMEVSEGFSNRQRRHHEASFAARFPELSEVEMAYSWGGKLCLSLNDVPAFGEIEDGMISACCQNGLGTARGTLSGIVAADLATGNLRDNHQSLERMLAYEPPKRLPPEPFASIGAHAVLRYREWRAGREL